MTKTNLIKFLRTYSMLNMALFSTSRYPMAHMNKIQASIIAKKPREDLAQNYAKIDPQIYAMKPLFFSSK